MGSLPLPLFGTSGNRCSFWSSVQCCWTHAYVVLADSCTIHNSVRWTKREKQVVGMRDGSHSANVASSHSSTLGRGSEGVNNGAASVIRSRKQFYLIISIPASTFSSVTKEEVVAGEEKEEEVSSLRRHLFM